MGMVGEACLPRNAYCPRMPDYTLYSGVHVCWSEQSDSPFYYGFMSLDNSLGTMTLLLKLTPNVCAKAVLISLWMSNISLISMITKQVFSLKMDNDTYTFTNCGKLVSTSTSYAPGISYISKLASFYVFCRVCNVCVCCPSYFVYSSS